MTFYATLLARSARFLIIALLVPLPLAAGPEAWPQPVSPGRATAFAPFSGACPTFSWGQAAEADAYEIAVYRLEKTAGGDIAWPARPTLLQQITGRASSFTPAADQCLSFGADYGWVVRGLVHGKAGEWSPPLFFRVAALPPPHEVAAALRTLEAYLAAGGTAPAGPTPREAAAVKVGPSPATPVAATSLPGVAAMQGENTDTSGAALGVAGVTHSADGAALAGDNLAGGPDLLLAGSGGAPNLELTESGLRRSSAGALTFAFENPGAGSLALTVDGVAVVTTATDQDQLADLSCADDQIVKRSAGVWACGEDLDTPTSGSAIFAAVLAQDGPGSLLDADLVDGKSATDFLPSLASGETIDNSVDQVIRFSDGSDLLDLDLSSGVALRTGDYQRELLIEPGPLLAPTGLLESGEAVRLVGGKGQFTWGGSVPGGEVKAGGANLNTGDCAAPSGGNCGGHVTISGGGGATWGYSGGGNVILRGGAGTGGWSTGHVLVLDSKLGIGLTQPSELLEVAGKVKANQFVGDGSLLTNLPAGTAGDLGCTACVSPGELDFDPASQAELDAEAAARTAADAALAAELAGRPAYPPVLALTYEFDRLPSVDQWTVTTTGIAQVVQVDPSFIRLDSGFGGPGSIDITSQVNLTIGGGALLFRSVVAAYRDGAVYGDRQPRGLVHGRDRGDAIEFLSASPTSVEMRTASGGVATSSYVATDNVYRFHVYQIYARADEVRFYLDGNLVAVHTTNIPSTPLNVYIGTDYPGGGTVPVDVDYVSFARVE